MSKTMSEGAKKAVTAGRVVLILGDAELVLPAAHKLIDEIIAPANQSTDLELLDLADADAADTAPARLLEACAQVGMFSPERCVWVRGLTTKTAEALLEAIEPGLPGNASLLMTAATLDKRTRVFKRLVALCELFDLGVPTGRDGRLEARALTELVSKRVIANGLPKPDSQTLAAIAARAGSQIGELLAEVDRLCLLSRPGDGLRAKDVTREMRDQAGTWVFDLTDAISSRQLAKAEMLIEGLVARGEPPQRIVGLVSARLGELCTASAALDVLGRPQLETSISRFSSGTYERLPESLRARWPRPARAFYLMREAAHFDSKELAGISSALLEMDLAFKSSRLNPLNLLSRFLGRACRPPGASRP